MPTSVIQEFDIFAQLVATHHIGATAQALAIPVAQVIEAMDGLEDRLGYRIFSTVGQKVELTATGRKLVSALGELTTDGHEQWINGLLADMAGNRTADREDSPTEESEVPLVPTFIGNSKGPAADGDDGAPANHAARLRSPASTADGADQPLPAPADDSEKRRDEAPVGSAASERPSPGPLPSTGRDKETRHITLASHPAIFSHFQEALIAFEEASPDISISLRLEAIDAPAVQRLFTRDEADIAYFYALQETQEPASRYAWSERVSLFVGKKHPLAKQESAMAADLAGTAYIALAPDNMTRQLAEQALAQNGLHVGTPLIETDNLYDIMKQVQSRPCFFAAFGSMARDFGKMPGITRLAYAQGLPQVQVRQALHPGKVHDPALMALGEFLFR